MFSKKIKKFSSTLRSVVNSSKVIRAVSSGNYFELLLIIISHKNEWYDNSFFSNLYDVAKLRRRQGSRTRGSERRSQNPNPRPEVPAGGNREELSEKKKKKKNPNFPGNFRSPW